MKKEDLCDAIGLLDDDLLHEADHFRAMRPRPHRHLRFLGGGLIAAALLLLFLMIPASPPVLQNRFWAPSWPLGLRRG